MSHRNLSQSEDDVDNPPGGGHAARGDPGQGFQRDGQHGSGQYNLRSAEEEYYGASLNSSERGYPEDGEQEYASQHYLQQDYGARSNQKMDGASQNFSQEYGVRLNQKMEGAMQNFSQDYGLRSNQKTLTQASKLSGLATGHNISERSNFSERYSVGREDVHSPMSTYSTHSHEVKNFLRAGSYEEDNSDRAAYSDYSHISIRARPSRNGCESSSSRAASLASDHSYKENFAPIQPHQPHPPPSSVISEPLHPRSYHGGSNVDIAADPLRRKSWSPPALRQNNDNAGYYNVRSCRSNDMVDWNVFQDPSNVDAPYMHTRGQNNAEGGAENIPPRLAPVSGVLTEKPGRNLIRPIAFKPLHNSHGNVRSPPVHKEGNAHPLGPPPPYSQLPPQLQQPPPPSFRAVGAYNNNLSRDTSVGSDRSANYMNESLRPADRVESPLGSSLDASRLSGHSHQSANGAQAMDVVGQTPSPSDSGVGELEAMLREKDAEILTLRQVMDRNERAIFQVYEEKKNAWLRDLREMKEDYEQKLKMQQRRAFKAEQTLSMQVCKLQQEKQQSQGEYEALFAEKEALKRQCATFQHQLHDVRLQLEAATAKTSAASSGGVGSNSHHSPSMKSESRKSSETQPDAAEFEQLRQQLAAAEEELLARNKEVMNLRSQLHTLQTDIETRNKDLSEKTREIVAKTEELKSVREELARLSAGEATTCDGGTQTSHSDSEVSTEENVKPSMLTQKDQTIASLQEEIRNLQEHIQELEGKLQDVDGVMETERLQWLEEKNKVIRYQKQLQLNYVQMQRKNTALEAEVEQLTLELESRDLKLIALNGEESVC